jgi:hypothetical protein
MTGTNHHTQIFIGLGEILLTFSQGWPWTTIFLISFCQVARITVMSHCTQLKIFLRELQAFHSSISISCSQKRESAALVHITTSIFPIYPFLYEFLLLCVLLIEKCHIQSLQCLDYLEFFSFFAVLGLELRVFSLSHSASPFCDGYFRDTILWTIYLGWLWTTILLISASWVARITGMSHWLPDVWRFLNTFLNSEMMQVQTWECQKQCRDIFFRFHPVTSIGIPWENKLQHHN